MCCRPWGCKELATTQPLNNNSRYNDCSKEAEVLGHRLMFVPGCCQDASWGPTACVCDEGGPSRRRSVLCGPDCKAAEGGADVWDVESH